MYTINFEKPIHIHFIGIGGISMSGLAEILMSKGFVISGSDNKESELTEQLRRDGAIINIGQSGDNITPDIDLVVYTAAIRMDNPEFGTAMEKNLPMLTRAELLGQMMRNYGCPIAIAGTHGKTTTSSLASEILLGENLDPTLSIGGILKTIGGNIRIGQRMGGSPAPGSSFMSGRHDRPYAHRDPGERLVPSGTDHRMALSVLQHRVQGQGIF